MQAQNKRFAYLSELSTKSAGASLTGMASRGTLRENVRLPPIRRAAKKLTAYQQVEAKQCEQALSGYRASQRHPDLGAQRPASPL